MKPTIEELRRQLQAHPLEATPGMSDNELEVKIKIGEIAFYAKGQPVDVDAQCLNFTSFLLANIDKEIRR